MGRRSRTSGAGGVGWDSSGISILPESWCSRWARPEARADPNCGIFWNIASKALPENLSAGHRRLRRHRGRARLVEEQADLAHARGQRDLADLHLPAVLLHRDRGQAVDHDVERVGGLALLDDGFAGIEALQLRDLDQLRELLGLEGAEQRALAHGGEHLRLQVLRQAESLHRRAPPGRPSAGGERYQRRAVGVKAAAAGYDESGARRRAAAAQRWGVSWHNDRIRDSRRASVRARGSPRRG